MACLSNIWSGIILIWAIVGKSNLNTMFSVQINKILPDIVLDWAILEKLTLPCLVSNYCPRKPISLISLVSLWCGNDVHCTCVAPYCKPIYLIFSIFIKSRNHYFTKPPCDWQLLLYQCGYMLSDTITYYKGQLLSPFYYFYYD